jgi:uncharacterized protein (DUF58 family)
MPPNNDILSRIRRLEIKAKGLTHQLFSGEYQSAFKGRGMAFSEVREYQLGDEVRTIDWNVTARHNQPYVKVFEEERELTVILLIDLSGSEWFGMNQRTKRDLLIEVAAVLAFSAVENKDKVGAIFTSDKVEKYIAPGKGKKHAMMLLHQLLAWDGQSGKTHLGAGLRFLQQTQKKRSITFVISDFYDEHFLEDMKLARKKHDLVAIQLTDAAEKELPNLGIVQMFNPETGETQWVNTADASVRKAYQNQFKTHEENRTIEFRRLGVDHALLDTDADLIPALVKLVQHRR